MILNRYKITVRATENGKLPGYLGSFLRGIFGETLHRYHFLAYRYFFKRELEQQHPLFYHIGRNPPSPYWFYIPKKIVDIRKDETFHFFLTLLETPFLPPESIPVLFRHAFEKPLYHNKFFGMLEKVEPAGFNQNACHIRLEHFRTLKRPSPDFRITFSVPVSLMRRKQLLSPADPFILFHFILNRAILLKKSFALFKNAFPGAPVDIPEITNNLPAFLHQELLKSKQLEAIKPDCIKLYRHTIYRSPSRHEKYPMKGIMGSFILKNVSDDFYKLLKVAGYLHVGSNTSVGFGKMIVEAV